MHLLKNLKLAIIGLGYVGLPLAVEFGKKRPVMGLDINSLRINDLRSGVDKTLEISFEELKEASQLIFTSDFSQVQNCNCFIITVPTPIDKYNQPDFGPLVKASESIGMILKKDDLIIYESTVYPGATEEVCVPILEKFSGLKFNQDFYCGYSPERINPGDKEHRLINIKKVTSGSTLEAANLVNQLYGEIILAGTYQANSIRVAEAAKVIENTQRDLNIAFINELAIIFNKLHIDTEEVLNAAGTKWNFLPFRPGLVGGHCIGVDPYYLTHKAQSIGYHPEVILAGRRLNDGMGHYAASQLIKAMINKNIAIENAKVLIMGFSFKENCPDCRNTKVIDIINELKEFSCEVDIYDPWISKEEVFSEYKLKTLDEDQLVKYEYDAIVLAVAHSKFKTMEISEIRSLGKPQHVLYDLKYIFPKASSDLRL
ncbi:Vi polysaccharide biosynthesis UDP-N-acetylglucosamine C-6 dehydrogenase TviB [Candidatus Methylopumilus planktonicus]|uniref:Vi polysaccharide biosynthesis UDP-N-acetylglucosamine C-6 dehydrogenase TviB n=1 Tax=Candidatus Methylopumilus planktonicus TaxID=1581557 RepID=UPI00111E80E4|nr:Vi polysaccharide biosynthesis UDP-N-acetylglucosamine C-6 dehydrogenase TviB [Candidatus Methylopumilus planktonicus]QDD00471.1 Vi polysaccharide biosynthesis UDP-N-acetylglucosamine C-6 dehydrogenase TviB [Candidatus Methylopumilus planktonicus]